MGCNYVLFVYLPFYFFLCLPLPLHLKFVQGNMPISWHRYCMFLVSGFQQKRDQDSFLLFYSCVEEGLRGNVLGHLRSLRCWPVNSVRQIYFVRHPTKSSENTHAEWAEYCTSSVLSLSIKPSGNLHPTSLLPLHKNKSVHICIIFLQNYRKHNLDSYGLFLLLFF